MLQATLGVLAVKCFHPTKYIVNIYYFGYFQGISKRRKKLGYIDRVCVIVVNFYGLEFITYLKRNLNKKKNILKEKHLQP